MGDPRDAWRTEGGGGVPAPVEQIAEAICRPEGTVEFEYSSDVAFKEISDVGVLIQVPAGGHLFRLERAIARVLRFYHSSPGTGTRVAEIALGDLPDFEQAFLAFTWTPQEICFYCGPRISGGSLLSARGERSATHFRIGQNGAVYELGGEGVELLSTRVREAGKLVLTPTAIEGWRGVLKAIAVLWTGRSDQGFMFEVVQTNATLSILVTGLETYAKTRLPELEAEGMEADWAQTFAAFASKAERDSGRLRELQDQAEAADLSVLEALIETGKINFQSYDQLKRAFKAAYGIRLGELSVAAGTLDQLQVFIKYRHRVVHVSPLLDMLNEEAVPSEEPVFANRATADMAVECFREFVEALHEATLQLRPEAADESNPSGGST
jgi:hypothetical protein